MQPKIVIAGSRTMGWKPEHAQQVDRVMGRLAMGSIILHGACGWNADDFSTQRLDNLRGADRLVDEWCREHGMAVVRYPAHWSRGKRGGPERTERMIRTPGVSLLIVFWDGKSPGSQRAIEFAKRWEVPCQVHYHDYADAAERTLTLPGLTH